MSDSPRSSPVRGGAQARRPRVFARDNCRTKVERCYWDATGMSLNSHDVKKNDPIKIPKIPKLLTERQRDCLLGQQGQKRSTPPPP